MLTEWMSKQLINLLELTLLVPELLRGHPNSVTHQRTISPLLLGGEWPGRYLDIRKEMVTDACNLLMVGRAWWSTWPTSRKRKLCHWRKVEGEDYTERDV